MLEDKLKVIDLILREVRALRDDVTSIDRDLASDRRSIQDFEVKLVTLEESVSQMRGAINLNADRVKDKVADVVGEVVESTDKLTTQIENKKTVMLKKKARNWWQRLFHRG